MFATKANSGGPRKIPGLAPAPAPAPTPTPKSSKPNSGKKELKQDKETPGPSGVMLAADAGQDPVKRLKALKKKHREIVELLEKKASSDLTPEQVRTVPSSQLC